MKRYWLPIPCINPPGDAYYACFAELGAGGDGGRRWAWAPARARTQARTRTRARTQARARPRTQAQARTRGAGASADAGAGASAGAGLAGLLRPGMDLTPLLVSGTTAQLQDARGHHHSTATASRHRTGSSSCSTSCARARPSSSCPRTRTTPIRSRSRSAASTRSTISSAPDDFVLGFTRVYAYDAVQEENPTISQVDLGGPSLEIDGRDVTTLEDGALDGALLHR